MTLAFFFVSFLLGQFFPGPTPSPTPSPSPSPTAEPLRINVRFANNENSPAHLYRASLTNARNFQYVQCISFRNVSAKVATDVDLSFVVKSYRGDVEADWGQLDKGTFTPPINIDNHCWYGRLWPKHVVRRMRDQVVRVKRVDFADGTSWVPGGVFMRAYANNGAKLPAPVPAQGDSNGPLPPATFDQPPRGQPLRGDLLRAVDLRVGLGDRSSDGRTRSRRRAERLQRAERRPQRLPARRRVLESPLRSARRAERQRRFRLRRQRTRRAGDGAGQGARRADHHRPV